MATARGRERAPSHSAYRGAVGATRQSSVQVTLPGGAIVSARVHVAVDVVSDPDLGQRLLTDDPERTLNAVRSGDGSLIPIGVPVIYHDPAAEVFALVLSEADRHRELEARAQLLHELAREVDAAVPTYVRDFAVVFGALELRAHLERLAEGLLAGERAAAAARDVERERGTLDRDRAALDRRKAELTAREAELDRRLAEVERRDRELDHRAAELDVAGADLAARRADLERAAAAAAVPHPAVDQEAPALPPVEAAVAEPLTLPVAAVPRTEHHDEVTSPYELVDDEAPVLPPSADPVTTVLEDAPSPDPDPWADSFADGGGRAAAGLDGGRVRVAIRVPVQSAAALTMSPLDVRVVLHRRPEYPVVALVIGTPAALRGVGPAHRVAAPIDLDADKKLLAQLERDFAVDLDLWLERRLLRRVRLRAPLAENVGYVVRAATDHRRSLSAPGGLARAWATINAPDHDLLGLGHDDASEFRVDKLVALDTANQVRRALAIARRFVKPAREDYLVTVRSFPLARWRELRTQVLVRAVALGLWMGPELAQSAVSEGLARSRKDLVSRLQQGFATLLADAAANDLDTDAIEDNRTALTEEAEALGVVPVVPGVAASDVEPAVSGTIAPRVEEAPTRDRAVGELIALLDDRQHRVAAALELCDRGDAAAVRPIMNAVRRMGRSEAVRVLGTMVKLGPAAAPALTAGLASSKAFLRHGCALALALLRTEEGTEAVIDALLAEPTEIWREIARAVGHVGPPALMPLAARLGRLGDRAGEAERERIAWAMAHVGVRGGRAAVETLAAGQSAVAPVARMALARTEPAARDDVQMREPVQREVTVNRAFSRRFFEALERGLPELAAGELEALDASGAMELLDDDDLLEEDDDDLDEEEAELDEADLLPG